MQEFIAPNWHVVFIHFPLGVFLIGLAAEIISIFWKNAGFRTAGRWMMAIGGLLSIVTVVSGIYAFRDVVISGSVMPELKWADIAGQSKWSQPQWENIEDHILANSFATVIIVTVIFLMIAFSEKIRKLYWLFLLAIIFGAILIQIGAWHGGELVYTYAVGIEGQTFSAENKLDFYVPPLELHIVLAGFSVAFAVGAFALTIRRWIKTPQIKGHEIREGFEYIGSEGEFGKGRLIPPVFWLIALLFALGTVLAGFWAVWGYFGFENNLAMLKNWGYRRLILHVIAGVTLVVAAIILIALTSSVKKRTASATIIALILVLAAVVQVWLGTMMLFDSHAGQLFNFK